MRTSQPNETDTIPFVPLSQHPRFKNLNGQTFGKLSVLAYAGGDGLHTFWWCRCECGKVSKTTSNSLQTGRTKSCGCLRVVTSRQVHRTHGISDTRTHRSWMSMRDRCNNKNAVAYNDYGGRGIIVCDRWVSFDCFLNDMGVCPSNSTIERINNNGNYTPENCRWASRKTQARNRRSSRHIVINGETINTAEAAERYGVPYKNLMYRLYAGWSDVDAVFGRPRK